MTPAPDFCPSSLLSLSVSAIGGGGDYFRPRLSSSADVCSVFHLLLVFISQPGFEDVAVCFWLL